MALSSSSALPFCDLKLEMRGVPPSAFFVIIFFSEDLTKQQSYEVAE